MNAQHICEESAAGMQGRGVNGLSGATVKSSPEAMILGLVHNDNIEPNGDSEIQYIYIGEP